MFGGDGDGEYTIETLLSECIGLANSLEGGRGVLCLKASESCTVVGVFLVFFL